MFKNSIQIVFNIRTAHCILLQVQIVLHSVLNFLTLNQFYTMLCEIMHQEVVS